MRAVGVLCLHSYIRLLFTYLTLLPTCLCCMNTISVSLHRLSVSLSLYLYVCVSVCVSQSLSLSLSLSLPKTEAKAYCRLTATRDKRKQDRRHIRHTAEDTYDIQQNTHTTYIHTVDRQKRHKSYCRLATRKTSGNASTTTPSAC